MNALTTGTSSGDPLKSLPNTGGLNVVGGIDTEKTIKKSAMLYPRGPGIADAAVGGTLPVRLPMPTSAGIGLRAQHHLHVLAEAPRAAWFEAHSENYFAEGGSHVECLTRIRADYPLSLHGVGLSLGSTDALDRTHLENLRRIIERFDPVLISEHLSWSSVGGVFANDLLPLPYTEEALQHVSRRIAQTQDALGRQLLLENVSSYLQFEGSNMTEWEFVAGVAAESGCGVLLDLNNIFVAAHNHGFACSDYLEGIPRHLVQEFHLAGHSRVEMHGQDLLIDTHGAPVCDAVWELYLAALRRFGDVPALIEWDTQIPSFDVLHAEAEKANLYKAAVLRPQDHAHTF